MNIANRIASKLNTYNRRHLFLAAIAGDLVIFTAGCTLVYFMVCK